MYVMTLHQRSANVYSTLCACWALSPNHVISLGDGADSKYAHLEADLSSTGIRPSLKRRGGLVGRWCRDGLFISITVGPGHFVLLIGADSGCLDFFLSPVCLFCFFGRRLDIP